MVASPTLPLTLPYTTVQGKGKKAARSSRQAQFPIQLLRIERVYEILLSLFFFFFLFFFFTFHFFLGDIG